MVRYSFLVRLSHPRLSAGFDRRFHGVPGILRKKQEKLGKSSFGG
jgi:hypothetical protein